MPGHEPRAPECRGHVFAGRELPADDDHVSAGAGIGRRDRQTESAGGAGDERDAPGQVEQFGGPRPPVGAAGARCQPAWTRRRAPWSRLPPRAASNASAPIIELFLSDSRGQHQIKVSEHLPDDQQRLLADDRLPPHLLADRKRARGPAFEDADDALASFTVLGKFARNDLAGGADRRSVTRKQPLQRHRPGPPQTVQVVDARPRPARVRGLEDFGVRRDLREQVVADERQPRFGVDEQRVRSAVPRCRHDAELAPAGPDAVAVRKPNVRVEALGRRCDVVPQGID